MAGVREFNLDGNRGCLVGNWQEERFLENKTGTARCSWTNGRSGRCMPDNSQTQQRTVQHEVRLEPNQWATNTQMQFKPPQDKHANLQYAADAKVGARSRAIEQKLYQMASQKEPRGEYVADFETTYTVNFTGTGKPETVGKRIQKTQDQDETGVARDYVFDKEMGLIASHTLERGEQRSNAPPPEAPVTIYSEEPENFLMSNARTDRPRNLIAKNSDFSVPIEHYIGKPVKDL